LQGKKDAPSGNPGSLEPLKRGYKTREANRVCAPRGRRAHRVKEAAAPRAEWPSQSHVPKFPNDAWKGGPQETPLTRGVGKSGP